MATQRHSKSDPLPQANKCSACQQEVRRVWPSCWRCQKNLGCYRCEASSITEVICYSCVCWGTLDALIQHGPIANTTVQINKRNGYRGLPLTAYPPSWQSTYAHREQEMYEELEYMTPRSEQGQQVTTFLLDIFKNGQPIAYEDVLINIWDTKHVGSSY